MGNVKIQVQGMQAAGDSFSDIFTVNVGPQKIGLGTNKYYELDTNNLKGHFQGNNAPDTITLIIGSYTLLLYRVDNDPFILTDKGKGKKGGQIVDYRGIVDGAEESLVSITISKHELAGFISADGVNIILGSTEHNKDVLYDTVDLVVHQDFMCDDTLDAVPRSGIPPLDVPGETTTKCVKWYWEMDYNVFQNKGSLDAVNVWTRNVFAQVQTLYANDGVNVALKTLFIWTSTSPYSGSTGNMLTQFCDYRKSWDGDLAHLIGFAGNGGVAYVNGIKMCEYGFCAPPCPYGQSSSQKGYSGAYPYFNMVPTYSWTIACIAHEMGHQLGLDHTHACVWNGNGTKIDDCGTVAGYPGGTCPPQPDPLVPVGGGTIMSYCHLTSTGINLSKGFGPQPTARMIANINASTCLTPCEFTPPPACVPTSETRTVACPAGNTGAIKQQRDFICPDAIWTDWRVVENTCTPIIPPGTICPNPFIIVCSITQRLNDVYVNRSGYTNYRYAWEKKALGSETYVKQTWSGQTVAKKWFSAGDILRVTVTSSNAQTVTKCYTPCISTIIIK